MSPAVSRRRLAKELRRIRRARDLTMQDVADYLEVSAGKISRLETAQVTARVQDVRGMLDLYKIDGPQREELLKLVRQSRKKAWWDAYTDLVPPDAATFYGLENGAARIDQYSIALVPGLLQTSDYARTLISPTSGVDGSLAKRRLELRMRRQQILKGDDAPEYHVILDEAVLRRVIG